MSAKQPRQRKMAFVCLREVTPLPELVHVLPESPFTTRRLIELGFKSRCRPMAFEGPNEIARVKLARHTCDQHNRPIMIVPPGSFAADAPRAS